MLAQEVEAGEEPEGEGGGAFAPDQVGGPPVKGARPACHHLQTGHSGCAGGVCTSAMHARRIPSEIIPSAHSMNSYVLSGVIARKGACWPLRSSQERWIPRAMCIAGGGMRQNPYKDDAAAGPTGPPRDVIRRDSLDGGLP